MRYRWRESVIESELAKTKILINASALSNAGETITHPGGVAATRPDGSSPAVHAARNKKLMAARAAGAAEVMNGDTMLLHQTAAAFNLWTGRDVPLDVLQQRLDDVRRADLGGGGRG